MTFEPINKGQIERNYRNEKQEDNQQQKAAFVERRAR
jgi:hypothetical protein